MDLMNQELAGSGSDLLEHLDRYCESEGGSGENEEEITSTPCHAAGEMNEQIDNRITSRQARRDNNKKNTKSQTRPCHNVCNRQTTKDRSKHSKNARPRSAGAKSPERRVTRGISINSNQKTVEMRRRLLELEKEVDLLHGENVSLRRQLTKAPPVQRLADETIHNRIQSGMKKEKKMFEMLLSDNERKFHELESKQRYLLEDKDTLQARIRIFEKEIENHINTLQQTRKELFTVKENNKEIAEENRLLKKENHVLKSRIQNLEAVSTGNSEHELILRQHMREEYQKKLIMLEKEILSMKSKGDKKKDVHRAKDKQELDIVTEHYQTVIKNLQVDREKVQRERDAAVLRVHQYKEKWSEKCKRDEIKSRGKIQVLERQVRELEMERGFLEEEKHSLEGRISKLLEKNENEAETLVQIGEVLRKHDNDLEKQVQELNREKEELAKEKEIHREQIRQYEKMKENLQTQLKTSREVLENRISELYLKNERLQTENAELKRCSNVKKEDWIRTISDIMGFEKASKSETESKFQSMIGTFQKEKKELDEELTCLRRRLKDIEEEKEKVVANKEKAINFQKEEIEKHKRESKSLIDERTLLMERLKEIEVKKEDMRNEANTAKQQMKIEFEELVEKIRDENSRLRQEKESLQSKVEELEYALTVKDIDDEENEQTDMVNYQKTIEELQEQVQRERQRFHEKEEKWKLLNETQTEKEEALNVRNASLERTVQKYLREIDTLKNRKETAVNEEMVQNIQTESKKLMEIEEQLERENQDLKAEKLTWGVQRKNLEERVRSMENQLEIKEAKVRSLTQDKIQLLQEIKTAQARCTEDDIYPKVNGDVSDSLQGGGTDVALLGERFNDLYENEFLESLKSLTNDSELFLDDRDAIESLLNILQTIFKECERLAEEQLDDLQMKVKQGTLKKSYSEYLEHCGVYVEKAIELCWLMNSVDPPITLDFTSQHGDTMDERKYRRFSGSGEIINFCVWPSILFQGHVLQKGVVQTTHLKS
uniref:Golgin subfamily A member 6-like protein 22 isoform X5 n=1 Tax=Crassostrea virginica TaxID=6565 RepID=A0A8B8DIR7_CRAVI|nr:golgin subfamily A member 6-like protein 22 isoform X5 [Crassostrea virginica]